jgi:hypothetical protein
LFYFLCFFFSQCFWGGVTLQFRCPNRHFTALWIGRSVSTWLCLSDSEVKLVNDSWLQIKFLRQSMKHTYIDYALHIN